MLNPTTPRSNIRRWRGAISAPAWPRLPPRRPQPHGEASVKAAALNKTFSSRPTMQTEDKRHARAKHFLPLQPSSLPFPFSSLSFLCLCLLSFFSPFLRSRALAAVCHALLISSWKMGISRRAGSGCGQLSLGHTHWSRLKTPREARLCERCYASAVI